MACGPGVPEVSSGGADRRFTVEGHGEEEASGAGWPGGDAPEGSQGLLPKDFAMLVGGRFDVLVVELHETPEV